MTTFDTIQSLLSTIPNDSRNISHLGFMLLVLSSVLISVACSYLYLFFYDKNSTGSKVYRAFPLMGPAITCIFLTVQFSLPLSLGLLGALSIVRFRTPIKEPEEIGFILLLIAFSLSIATFNLSFTVILYVVAFITLYILKSVKGFSTQRSGTSLLHIEVSIEDASSAQTADKIVQTLNSNNITSNVISINQQQKMAFITLRVQKSKASLQQVFECVTNDYPAAVVNFHEG